MEKVALGILSPSRSLLRLRCILVWCIQCGKGSHGPLRSRPSQRSRLTWMSKSRPHPRRYMMASKEVAAKCKWRGSISMSRTIPSEHLFQVPMSPMHVQPEFLVSLRVCGVPYTSATCFGKHQVSIPSLTCLPQVLGL